MALSRLDSKKDGRVPTGRASEIVISDSTFIQQHRAFERSQAPPAKKRKREGRGDSSVVYGASAYKGPWARYEERRPDATASDEDAEDDEEVEVVYEEDEIIPAQPAAPASKAGTAYEETGDGKESSEFHGSDMYDYQGRTYMHVPQDLGHIDLRKEIPLEERRSYVPKKLIHTWRFAAAESDSKSSHRSGGFGAASAVAAQQKAVTQVKFFPEYGHLLLSSYSDAKIRLWDVYHQRELLRSYSGHSKAIADIDFTSDGRQFFSAAYDRRIKQWDTETGACLGRISPGATPHVLRTNPTSPSEFLVGLSDKRILQYDVRVAPTGDSTETDAATGISTLKPTQDYNYHLGPVNTLTFCDESRRFISTSDDRSLRAWEYGIPVPIKLVSEPEMYAMTRSCLHPNGKHVLYQSSDNQIIVYDTIKFRQHRKKSFRGHNTAGYSIDVAVSPDGSLVASGDSAGWLCFWDWKTCKMYDKILVGGKQGVAQTCVAWQPKETSKVAVGGLDSVVRYYD